MSYSEEALDQLDRGQLDKFKKAYASALRHDDDDTLYNLAEELYTLGFLNQSRRIYEKLLDRYPEENDIRVNLADIAIDEDKNDEALDYLNQVSEDSEAYVRASWSRRIFIKRRNYLKLASKNCFKHRRWHPKNQPLFLRWLNFTSPCVSLQKLFRCILI